MDFLTTFFMAKNLNFLKIYIPMTNKEWMNERSWSWWKIWRSSSRPLSNRWNRRLICITYSIARRREGRRMVLPTVIMDIHGRKSIGTRDLTRYWWTIPVTVKTRNIWNTATGVRRWWVNWSKISNIWARMSSRWYCCGMFAKYGMLSQ
jgi:hypothetical protein